MSGTLNETQFVLRDYLDPVAILTAAGVVDERYGYDAFGPVRVMDANFATRSSSTCAWNWLYHGEFLDGESGMYDCGYRFYHPTLGRWPSRDPIGERGGLNLYGLVGNSPTGWIDFLGAEPAPTVGAPPPLPDTPPGPSPTIPLPGQPGHVPPIDDNQNTADYNCAGAAFRDYSFKTLEEAESELQDDCYEIDCGERCPERPVRHTKFTLSKITTELWFDGDNGYKEKQLTAQDWHLTSGEGGQPQKYSDGPICYRPTTPSPGIEYPGGRPVQPDGGHTFYELRYKVISVEKVTCYCCCDNDGDGGYQD